MARTARTTRTTRTRKDCKDNKDGRDGERVTPALVKQKRNCGDWLSGSAGVARMPVLRGFAGSDARFFRSD